VVVVIAMFAGFAGKPAAAAPVARRKPMAEHHCGHDDGAGGKPEAASGRRRLAGSETAASGASAPRGGRLSAPCGSAPSTKRYDAAATRPDADTHTKRGSRQGDVDPRGAHEEHGPMPQVDAVRALPIQTMERCRATCRDGRGRVDGDEDDQRRDAGEHEISAA